MSKINIESKLEKILLKVQKPARYTGGELHSITKPHNSVDLSVAFCFPDTYEIGMSHLGAKILYSLINAQDNYLCERCFMPLADMQNLMRSNNIKLYGLENKTEIQNFDIIAFTLQYELSYTTVLAMLDLADVPLKRTDRADSKPLVIAGGPCACNPAPLVDFIDVFVIGEGEEVTLELLDLISKCKKNGVPKSETLQKISELNGCCVPAYSAEKIVSKRVISDLDSVFYPETFVMPFIDVVHDRAVTEVLRGCIRGCRFCQAGFICRPYREKSKEKILIETKCLCESTGYDEVSLCSLSTSDHSDVENVLADLTDYTDRNNVNLAMPSLRIDKFNDEMLRRIKSVRKSTLTFAPEAGTQRLRDVINKNITEENILDGCRVAFSGGYNTVKLYFMLGLPTETDEDIAGIHALVTKIMKLYKECGPDRAISVSISLSTFVPKPHTPFQYEPMISREEATRRQKLLLSLFTPKSKKIKISFSDYDSAYVEAVLARGDENIGAAVLAAYQNGCMLDSWGDYFNFSKWQTALDGLGDSIVYKQRSYDEALPWQNINMLVSADYLVAEHKNAHAGVTTPSCREKCSGCGIDFCKKA